MVSIVLARVRASLRASPRVAPVAALAEQARRNRRPCVADSPWLALQENASERIVSMLDSYREFTEAVAERIFLSVYGSPTLQAAFGIAWRRARSVPKIARRKWVRFETDWTIHGTVP
jgi:Protein of unknown function (DUF3141)